MLQLVEGIDLNQIINFVDHGVGGSNFDYLGSGINGDAYKFEDMCLKVFKDNANETNDGAILNHLQQIENEFYPKVFAFENNKFVLSEFVEGKTFYQIEKADNHLVKEYKKEIEEAFSFANSVGLNPMDVHLNNMMLTNEGHLKIVDVGRFSRVRKNKPVKLYLGSSSSSSGFFSSESYSGRGNDIFHSSSDRYGY